MTDPCAICDSPTDDGLRLVVHLTGAWNLVGESERWFCLGCSGVVIRALHQRGFVLDEKHAGEWRKL